MPVPGRREVQRHRAVDAERDQQIAWLRDRLPLETLVPEAYAEWRPLVRDAFAFIAAHLTPERWRSKLAEQAELPADASPERRLYCFLARMPTLQKIGQILARNPHLDPSLGRELERLEDAIADASPAEIRAEIERQLGERLDRFRVEIEPRPLAEASVSVVMAFRWSGPGAGVLKVRKPYVEAALHEELALLADLASDLDARRGDYGLEHVELGAFFREVRELLAGEVDFEAEQRHLAAARKRYRAVRGVRVPKLIAPLSTSAITAMERARGCKVTDLRSASPRERRRVGERLFQAFLLAPMLAREEVAVFHADPHAGNSLWDAEHDELVLLDWALTEVLSAAERRHIAHFVLAVALRDEWIAWRTLGALRDTEFETFGAGARARRILTAEMTRLAWLAPDPGSEALSLLDQLVRAGLRFSRPLLMLRKVLFTLQGVVDSMASPATLTSSLVDYRAPARSPLSLGDWVDLGWSAAAFPARAAWHLNERAWEWSWRLLQAPRAAAART